MPPPRCSHTFTELENTGTRIDSNFVPEHADLIQGQRKKQKRLERRIKRGILMVAGWTLNAAMIYLILVTARITPKLWDPYDVLGVSRVCTLAGTSALGKLTWVECGRERDQEALPKALSNDASR
jgi:hypothetical protein